MLWLMACTPPESVTERHMWESFIALEDGNVLMLRMAQGNTGIFKELTSLRLSRTHEGVLEPHEYVMRGTAKDSHFTSDGARIGPQQLYYENGWNIRIRDSLHNVQASLSDSLQSPISLYERDNWRTDIHGLDMHAHGWLQMGEYSKPLSGQALLLEHRGSAVHFEHRELWVLNLKTGSLVIAQSDEEIHGTYSKANLGPELSSPLMPKTHLTLDELQIDIGPMQLIGTIDPHAHVSSLERILSQPFYPTPSLRIGQGELTVTGPDQVYIARYLRILRDDF